MHFVIFSSTVEFIVCVLFQPHTDGPLYFPTVANITLGSHTVLEWYHPLDRKETGTDSPDKMVCLICYLEQSLVLILEL